MQSEQLLHELVRRIEKICVGFDDHKQSVFNLVQSLKTLFLYSQSENETVEEYTRNFQSLWDTVEAFGGSPGIQDGLVEAELRRRNIANPSPTQLSEAEDVLIEQVKAVMLISGASRQKYGKLTAQIGQLSGYAGEGGKNPRQLPKHESKRTLQSKRERDWGGVHAAWGTRRSRRRKRRTRRPRSEDRGEERLGRFLGRRWRQREHDHRSHKRRRREDKQQGGVALLQLRLSEPLGI